MVQQQQPFSNQLSVALAANNVGPTTLAMPAIISNNQPAQYSPQASYYQQQLVKSAQQQFMQHQQPNTRSINGLQNFQQQDSPSAQQTQIESLYNQTSGQQNQRVAPIYAPKPTYYHQQQQQQPVYQQQSNQQVWPVQQNQFQQQNSPSNSARNQMQQVAAFGPRHLQVNGVLAQPNNLSPQTQNGDQRMQQLIMSYQQQQLAVLPANEQLLQPQTYIHNAAQEQLVQQQQHVDVRWSRLEEQNAHFQQHRPAMARPHHERGAHISDRDSISTVSRFNQLDERRSITMRSQYTNNNTSARSTSQFSVLKLTCEAFKRILGLQGAKADHRLLLSTDANNKQNLLHRNLNLTVTESNSNNKNIQPFSSSNSAAKVTVIDSGEDYYFKKRVFKYQLLIMRLINLLSAALVLLSPVAMLLIPKMESFFRGHEFNSHEAATSSQTSGSSIQAASDNIQTQNSPPSITHAVGLSGLNKQPFYLAQPQWRISECNSDCDGPLIAFVARLLMLCVAFWAIFFRQQTATLPRIEIYRCLLSSMALLLTLAYWLFFIFRVFDKRYNDFELQYMTIVQFALSMLESLILLHYLAVILLELRQRKKVFCLKVVRSPDGASQYYSCGSLSIQKCAQFVLEKYHRDFKNYSAYAEQLLELENELARSVANTNTNRRESDHNNGNRSPRSRPTSPANSVSSRPNRRSTSRASRHHSRSGANHRSPSRSPINSTRSRSQSKPKSFDLDKSNSRSNQVKLYQVDLNPPEQNNTAALGKSEQPPLEENANSRSKSKQDASGSESKQHENDSNSADQSSDATSRMKESSLETIRAANSSNDLLSQQQKAAASMANNKPSTLKKRNNDEQQQARDETESVRSVRSRRSTSRSHHRRRDHREHRDHHHRERSSSRANELSDTADDQHHHHHRHLQSVAIPLPTHDQLEDHERKLRRRKFRLLVAVQDTFDQIKQIDTVTHNNQPTTTDSNTSLSQQQQQPKQALSPNQAARALYPRIARSLQKYLRLTKQTGCHNLQSIYEHLSKCLLYKLSARAFLEKFLNQDPVWQQSETNLFAGCKLTDTISVNIDRTSAELEINSWSLICDTLLSRQVNSGTFFVLKQGQVSLLVTVAKLPHLNLTEEVLDPKSCKFTLKPSSETSV